MGDRRRLSAKQKQQQDEGALRRPKVYALRIAGAQIVDIARQFGISPAQASTDYTEALAERKALLDEEAEHARVSEDSRLEMAMVAIAAQVRAGHLGAIREWRALSESRRKLWGIDSPARTELTGKDGGPLDVTDSRAELLGRLAQLAARAGTPGSGGHSDGGTSGPPAL